MCVENVRLCLRGVSVYVEHACIGGVHVCVCVCVSPWRMYVCMSMLSVCVSMQCLYFCVVCVSLCVKSHVCICGVYV